MFIFLLSFLLVAFYLLRREYLSRTRRHREYGDKIPGPKPLPLIGNALEFGLSSTAKFQYMTKVTKDFGPVSRLWIGPLLTVVIADPAFIEALLGNSKNLNKSSLYSFTEPLFKQGLLVSKAEIWKKHRKIIAPTFNGQILAQFVDVFKSNLDVLTNVLSKHVNGPEIDLFPFMCLFTLDVICESAMGVKVNAQIDSESDYVKGINCLGDVMFQRATSPWLHPDIIYRFSSLGQTQAKYLPIITNMTKRVIQERKQLRSTESATNTTHTNEDNGAGYKKKRAFLDYLLDLIENGAELTNQELEEEVDNIMAAGNDTTSISICYTCWLLAKHQHIQERVVEELRTIFGDSLRHSTSQDLNEMTYLEQVIKESLRLYPPVPQFGRQLSEDIITDKYVLPAGCEVLVSAYMLHRHPHHFPDPERFDPDRFLPENSVGRHPYCYIPFGAGLRICLGYKFAMQEMKSTLSQLLRHFKILPAENPFLDLNLGAQITMKSTNGIRMKLQSRNFLQR